MDCSHLPPLRSLPRIFLHQLAEQQLPSSIELPAEELHKIRNVLRLGSGDQVAILPNDGRIVRCVLEGKKVTPISIEQLLTESEIKLTLIIALPKVDKLETSLRMGTEMGVKKFVLFPSERSLIRWESNKLEAKLMRFESIIRESAEVSYRAVLPTLEYHTSLKHILRNFPEAYFLSEIEDTTKTLEDLPNPISLVIGPEGGWAPKEVSQIKERSITLGPRVFRVDTAVAAACALALLR